MIGTIKNGDQLLDLRRRILPDLLPVKVPGVFLRVRGNDVISDPVGFHGGGSPLLDSDVPLTLTLSREGKGKGEVSVHA